MSLLTVSVTVCLFLAHIAADTGVHFVMKRQPDSYFCGHLQCVADLTKSDHDVSTFVEMTIYDITQVNSELKLASVSAFHPDLYVDTTKSSAVSCTGIISRLQANLTLKLRHDIDCLYGAYKCQLDLVTESGHPEVRTEIVIPENNHNYTRVAEVISHIDKLTGLFNIHTTLVSNQTTVIDTLESHLVDITSQLMNQTAEITIQLKDQTAAINKLESRVDHQITKLVNQTEEISKQGSRLGSQLDELTAQLINQTAQLHNMSERLDLETTKQKQHKLDTTQKLSDQMADMPQEQGTCVKGQPHRHGTKRITLWGNTTALCDTTTDEGGWVIIQRRTNGDVDFFKGWEEYKIGFGHLDTDFWLGNDAIHLLAEQGYNELRIDLIYQRKRTYAHYSNFSVASEAANYRLTVGAFEGPAGDSLTYHNNMYFSTSDRNNDKSGSNCPNLHKGAWWFNGCYHSNLNGLWGVHSTSGVTWNTLTRANSVSFSEMKIRRG